MEPFPFLKSLAGERAEVWKHALVREMKLEADLQDQEILAQLQSFLPLWLKKNQRAQKLPEFWVDLADYEWSKHWINSQNLSSHFQTKSQVQLNPVTRILRLQFGILEWLSSSQSKDEPQRRPHILVVAPRGQVEANFEMAAILDELSESAQSEADLIALLVQAHGPKEWGAELWRLENIGALSRD